MGRIVISLLICVYDACKYGSELLHTIKNSTYLIYLIQIYYTDYHG